MNKLCYAFFKYENELKLVDKVTHSFEVHSNESACRKEVRLGLEQVRSLLMCEGLCSNIVSVKNRDTTET